MRKIFIAMLLVLTMPAMAQRAKEEIKADRNLAASNYLAYPGPKQKLTKAPEGYTPYYISHYGRHGSRYLINPAQYSDAVNILAKADSLDKLSPRGHDVLDKVRMLSAEAQGRLGELTPLGAEQHRGIAHRCICASRRSSTATYMSTHAPPSSSDASSPWKMNSWNWHDSTRAWSSPAMPASTTCTT